MNAPATVNVEARVLRLLAEQLGQREEDLARENTLFDLGADSLDKVEIAMALEDEFTLEIADEELEPVVTVGNVIDLVRRKLDPEATVP